MEAVINIVLWLGDFLGSGFVRNVLLLMLFLEVGGRPFYKNITDMWVMHIEKPDLIASRLEKAK